MNERRKSTENSRFSFFFLMNEVDLLVGSRHSGAICGISGISVIRIYNIIIMKVKLSLLAVPLLGLERYKNQKTDLSSMC